MPRAAKHSRPAPPRRKPRHIAVGPVAIQGEIGSFSHQVAQRFFGEDVALLSCDTFPQLFQAISSKRARAGIIPIENALFGSIHQNFDLLLEHQPTLWAEAYQRIEMCLVSVPGRRLKAFDQVLVHPVAQGQVTEYLKRHKLTVVPALDTAGAVRVLMEQKTPNTFAIASALAAKVHGAKVLARGIEDDARNFTRFLIVGNGPPIASSKKAGAKKTSLAFVLPNVPGSLFHALGAFSLREVNLAKLESRPIRGRPFEYMFYLDALGSLDDVPVQRAIAHLKEVAEKVWVLGAYDRASL